MHVKNVHECQFCGEAFELFEDKFTHILLNHKDFCCEFCDKIFSTTDRLKRDILSLRLEISVNLPKMFANFQICVD